MIEVIEVGWRYGGSRTRMSEDGFCLSNHDRISKIHTFKHSFNLSELEQCIFMVSAPMDDPSNPLHESTSHHASDTAGSTSARQASNCILAATPPLHTGIRHHNICFMAAYMSSMPDVVSRWRSCYSAATRCMTRLLKSYAVLLD
jgi:hypothetical protein